MKLRKSRSEVKALIARQVQKGAKLESEYNDSEGFHCILRYSNHIVEIHHTPNAWLETSVRPG